MSFLLKRQDAEARYQLSVVSLDELVPSDHLVRKIEKASQMEILGRIFY